MSFLARANEKDFEFFSSQGGKSVVMMNLKEVPENGIVAVNTISGNTYYIEGFNSSKNEFHFYRLKKRGKAQSGYRGIRKLPGIIRVGIRIFYLAKDRSRYSATSRVTDIQLFQKP